MGVEDDFQLPTGFRFHPTDEELVTNYLCRKCAGKGVAAPIIADVEIYRHDPWDLPEMALYGEKEWYFFSPRDRKYPNGSRPNRSAGSGYWKATGVDKPIGFPKPLGIKKALVFYAGKAPEGTKTNWIMHEYRLANVDRSVRGNYTSLRLDEWVLCRIYKKKGGPPDRHTGPTSVRAPKQMQNMGPPRPTQQQSPLDYCLYFENSSPYREYCRESEVTETWKGAEWDRKNEFSIENVVRLSPPPLMSQPPLLGDVFMYHQGPYYN